MGGTRWTRHQNQQTARTRIIRQLQAGRAQPVIGAPVKALGSSSERQGRGHLMYAPQKSIDLRYVTHLPS